jgi:hypothetical protein
LVWADSIWPIKQWRCSPLFIFNVNNGGSEDIEEEEEEEEEEEGSLPGGVGDASGSR